MRDDTEIYGYAIQAVKTAVLSASIEIQAIVICAINSEGFDACIRVY